MLRLHEDRKAFRLNEPIELDLCFSSSIPDHYKLDQATYDRSGRMSLEEFKLDSSDSWRDPLVAFLRSGVGFPLAGGLRGISDLDDKPRCLKLILNEWVRFDRAGYFRLYTVSRRVGQFETVSNVIELEILPATSIAMPSRLQLEYLDTPEFTRYVEADASKMVGVVKRIGKVE